MAFVKRRRSFSFNIEVENLDDGLLVRQGSEAYVARNWQLTPATEELIEAAIEAGLPCVIQHDHPRRNSRWPNTRGVAVSAKRVGSHFVLARQ